MSKPATYLNFLQSSNNFLLVKDGIGKAKPSTRALPSEEFVYGKKPKDDGESVGSLLKQWDLPRPSKVPKLDKDFKKLNALSVTEKACTPSEVSKFRKTTEIRLKTAQSKSRPVVPDIIFGNENRPSTPIKAVISNFYGDFAAENMNSNFVVKPVRSNVPPSRSTKGFDKRNEAIRSTMKSQEKTQFKIKKFESVQCKTNTGRNNNKIVN